MLATSADLWNDLVLFLDDPPAVAERLLQQTTDSTTRSGSETGFKIVAGICFLGVLMILLAVFGFLNRPRHYCCASMRRVNEVNGAPNRRSRTTRGTARGRKTPKSTLAQRKHAILELFETSKVTMKVKEEDIHVEEGCITADLESGFAEGGILTLSRPGVPPVGDVPNLCVICLDSYQPGQVVAWSSGCRHAFHQDCIAHYLAKKIIAGETPCPSCRQKFCDLPEEPFLLNPCFSSSLMTGDMPATTASESREEADQEASV